LIFFRVYFYFNIAVFGRLSPVKKVSRIQANNGKYINWLNPFVTCFCYERANLRNGQTNKLYSPMIVARKERDWNAVGGYRNYLQYLTVHGVRPLNLILFNFWRRATLRFVLLYQHILCAGFTIGFMVALAKLCTE